MASTQHPLPQQDGNDSSVSSNVDPDSIRIPHLPDDLDFQVAIDQLSTEGNTSALSEYLANAAGVDPKRGKLVMRPWEFDASQSTELTFLGKLDNVDDAISHTDKSNAQRVPIVSDIDVIADVKSRKPFSYHPLNTSKGEIRLLELGETSFPGHFDRLRFQVYPIDQAPEYHCISYVWGDSSRFIPVNCDGKYLMLTSNLYHAIRKGFERYPDMLLWADGLCINQEDLVERALQVRMMGRIYSGCKQVLAFPEHSIYKKVDDESSLETNVAMEIQSISSQTKDSIQDKISSKSADMAVPRMPTSDNITDLMSTSDARQAISLMNLLARVWSLNNAEQRISWEKYRLPDHENDYGMKLWFRMFEFWKADWLWRTWVLAECVLPPKVVVFYSEYVVSLDAVMEFWDTAAQKVPPRALRHGWQADLFNRTLHTTPVTTFAALRKRLHHNDPSGADDKSHQTRAVRNASAATQGTTRPQVDWITAAPTLLELLALSRNNQATDPRDKVYAMLGLANDSVARSIPQSYHESNTVCNTYIDFARRQVEMTNSLEVLEHAGIHTEIPGLPSWAPDWTCQRRSLLTTHDYTATPSADTHARFYDNNLALNIRATTVSTVASAGPAWRYYTSDTHDSESWVCSQPFAPLQPRSGTDAIPIPAMWDEDSRNFILTFATNFANDPETSHLSVSHYGADLTQATLLTLTADTTWTHERISTSSETLSAFLASYAAFKKFYARGPDEPGAEDTDTATARRHISGFFHWMLDFPESEDEKLMHELWPFAMALQNAQRGRRFAVLADGRFATIPWDAERGDEVVLVQGGRVPFVVRRDQHVGGEEEGDECVLIGDCYVHGVMDGELFEAIEGDVSDKGHVIVGVDRKGYSLRRSENGQRRSWRDITLH